MASSYSRNPSQPPIGPLSIGNVVSAGIRLYRSHFQQYLGIAAQATLWIALPLLGFLLFGAFLIVPILISVSGPAPSFDGTMGAALGIFFLMILAAIPVFIYCGAKSVAIISIISRLAFGELINQPESVSTARRWVNPQMWKFWLAGFIFGCISGGVSFVFSFFTQFVTAIALVFASSSGIDPAIGGIISSFVYIVVQLLNYAVQLWLSARLLIYNMPIAVEDKFKESDLFNAAGNAIARAWQLTKGNSLRIMAVLFIGYLISLPFYILPVGIGIVASLPFIPQLSNAPESWLWTLLPIGIFVFAVFAIGAILVIPLWQTIFSVIYYDLRTRREGLGLQLRDR
jgi:hypothetical protein